MGSSYSDLSLYFKVKTGTYGFPNNGQPNNGGRDNKKQIFSVTVKKSNYQECVNFEKVTHDITFTPTSKGTNYNIILNDSCDKDKGKGKNVFGYYYPSTNNEVLKELHVYYSVLAPNDPLVVSFYTKGQLTHNFLYSGLLSTGWVRAYSIAYYSLGQNVSSELLKNEFRKSHRNRKIQFITGEKVEQVSVYKQELEKGNVYRYIYYPNGNTSILGSECLNNINSKTSMPESPKSTEDSKPASETSSSPEPAKSETQAKSPTNYDNKIDPYYLDFVNGHYYDGVILYFVKNGNNQGNANNNNQAGSSQQGNNASGQGNSEKYDKNMAVLLELIDNCNTKTHIKRRDKHGYCWSEEKVKYNDYSDLIKQLKEFRETADKDDSTTFILENRDKYKGVSKVDPDKGKKTYSKYTHSANATNITNLLFRKNNIQIGSLKPSEFKTKTLDIYFLKIGDKEQGYPFILVFTYQDDKSAEAKPPAGGGAGSAGTNGASSQPQQPASGSGGGGGDLGASGSASTQKECKKCYFSSENYEFTKWLELTTDKKTEAAKEKKEQTDDQAKQLQDKLDKRLTKIEQYGQCTKDINILRSIAYQVLIGVDEPDTKKAVEPEPVEGRPEIKRFRGDIGGTSLKVVLGSVAAGLVVLGIIGAIIYGIYWYNTTIKLLT